MPTTYTCIHIHQFIPFDQNDPKYPYLLTNPKVIQSYKKTLFLWYINTSSLKMECSIIRFENKYTRITCAYICIHTYMYTSFLSTTTYSISSWPKASISLDKSKGSPVIRSHISSISTQVVWKWDVASYDLEINAPEALPSSVGSYKVDTVKNLCKVLPTKSKPTRTSPFEGV